MCIFEAIQVNVATQLLAARGPALATRCRPETSKRLDMHVCPAEITENIGTASSKFIILVSQTSTVHESGMLRKLEFAKLRFISALI